MKRLLMVCLGNICRSPLAEGIMREKIKLYNISAIVDSAGTSDYHVGETPDKRSIANGLKYGIDISRLVARQFSVKDFELFDHIYVMDKQNYKDVLMLARHKQDKQKVDMILNTCYPGLHKPVPDPYFGGEEGFEEVFRLLDEACEKIAYGLKQ